MHRRCHAKRQPHHLLRVEPVELRNLKLGKREDAIVKRNGVAQQCVAHGKGLHQQVAQHTLRPALLQFLQKFQRHLNVAHENHNLRLQRGSALQQAHPGFIAHRPRTAQKAFSQPAGSQLYLRGASAAEAIPVHCGIVQVQHLNFSPDFLERLQVKIGNSHPIRTIIDEQNLHDRSTVKASGEK